MSRLLLLLPLLVGLGCAANRNHFEPTSVNDPGPWPIEQHTSGLVSEWWSVGRYRTSVLGGGEAISSKNCQQVAFADNVKLYPTCTIQEADGPVMQLYWGHKGSDSFAIKLGSLTLPLASDGVGKLTQDGQTVAEYFVKQKFDETDRGFIDVGGERIVIKDQPAKGNKVEQWLDSSRQILQFWRDDTLVGVANITPKRTLFLDPKLPEPFRISIAALTLQAAYFQKQAEQQQTANSLSMSARLAAPK